jgi:hypothetical protein
MKGWWQNLNTYKLWICFMTLLLSSWKSGLTLSNNYALLVGSVENISWQHMEISSRQPKICGWSWQNILKILNQEKFDGNSYAKDVIKKKTDECKTKSECGLGEKWCGIFGFFEKLLITCWVCFDIYIYIYERERACMCVQPSVSLPKITVTCVVALFTSINTSTRMWCRFMCIIFHCSQRFSSV